MCTNVVTRPTNFMRCAQAGQPCIISVRYLLPFFAIFVFVVEAFWALKLNSLTAEEAVFPCPGVVIAGALIWWHQGDQKWAIADPICTFVFAGLVMMTTCPIFRSIVDIIMERVPRELKIENIAQGIVQVDGVKVRICFDAFWDIVPACSSTLGHFSSRSASVMFTCNVVCHWS